MLEYLLGYLLVLVHSFGFYIFDWIYFLEFKNYQNYQKLSFIWSIIAVNAFSENYTETSCQLNKISLR